MLRLTERDIEEIEQARGGIKMKKYQVVKKEWNQFARKMFESVIVKDSSKKDAETLANEFNKSADPVTEIYEVREQMQDINDLQ